MASSVTVDLGISKYKKSYEFKTDWYHQRPDSGYFRSLQLSDDELEEDMKDEIDSVMGLLDRLKEDRKQELMSSQTEKLSRLEKLKRSRLRESGGVDTEHAGIKHTSKIETRVSGSQHPPDKPIDVKIRLNRDDSRDEEEDDLQEGYREGQQKRKQDTIIAELREKAQIISKSARKGPEDVASALTRAHDIEEDPEAAQYLRKIRHADAEEASENKENKAENKVERSVVTMDFPSPTSPRKTSVTVKLNLDMQKSKIAVARGSGLQGRRKPTTEHIRRSLRLSDDEEPEDVLAAGYEAEHEDMNSDVNAAISPVEANSVESAMTSEQSLLYGEPIEARIMPTSPVEYGQKITLERRGSFEGLIPRSTPKERKPAWKSKTYGGVALPAFAEAMKAGSKSLKKTDTAEKLLTADIVKQAALNKLNKAAKEDRPEKEPEKPTWLAEAESRRKHHDRRRQAVKQKPPEPEAPGVPIRLRATGSKIFEDEPEKPTTSEPQEDLNTNKFVVKLKPVSKQGEKPTFEPEEAKISFKLKSTGIQLIKPKETQEEPESTGVQREEPEPTNIKHEPQRMRIQREEPAPAKVKYFEITPRTKDTEVKKAEEPAMTVRLRHVPERTSPPRRKSEPNEESELAIKLRLRGKAPPIHPDEEDELESQEYHTVPRTIEEPSTQTFKSYITPKPVKTTPPSDYKAVQLEGRYLEKAKIIIPPTRTKAESTPPMSPTQTHAKPFYKVTPISSEPPRHIRQHNEFILPATRTYEPPIPQPSPSSRAFSPPPLSPTSKVTVVSHHVDTPPIKNKAAVPYKAFKGRRVSGERAKTVTVQAGDIPRIIPGRRSSSGEHPLKATVRRSSSLEYPRSHVQAPDAHLKHAVTVIKDSQVPQKAKTVMMTDRPLDNSYKPEQPGQVLPSWKQDLMERHRAQRYMTRDSEQSMSPGSLSNKENEPRIITQVEPLWMRELADKRRNVYNRTQSNGDIQFERIETFERFEKPPRSEDSDEEVREKPSFMKEFERKRRLKGRGPQRSEHGYQSSSSSYV